MMLAVGRVRSHEYSRPHLLNYTPLLARVGHHLARMAALSLSIPCSWVWPGTHNQLGKVHISPPHIPALYSWNALSTTVPALRGSDVSAKHTVKVWGSWQDLSGAIYQLPSPQAPAVMAASLDFSLQRYLTESHYGASEPHELLKKNQKQDHFCHPEDCCCPWSK